MADARLLETLEEARHQVRTAQARGERVGLVPTRGHLHDGHAALIRTAHAQCDLVIVSIISADGARHADSAATDLTAAAQAGAHIVWRPNSGHITSRRSAISIVPVAAPQLASLATAIAQQLSALRPDVVYVGEHHYEHARLVHDVVTDLLLDVEVRAVATPRDPDGIPVGLISRMPAEHRQSAAALPRALERARKLAASGETSVMRLRARAEMTLTEAAHLDVEFVDIMDADTWQPLDVLSGDALLVISASVAGVRISDAIRITAAPATSS